MTREPLKLSSGLFWDIDPAFLDYKVNAGFVITRVLMRGTLADWESIKSYYGWDRIRKAALDARYLDKRTLAFCSAVFSESINNFRCYTFRQLIPEAWNY